MFARNSNSRPNRSDDRTCRASVSRTFRSALTWFNSDARSRRCLGCLFVARQGEKNAVTATTGNFVRAVPFAAALSIIFLRWLDLDLAGVIYAIISGAVTSGLGYVIWYSVLPSLKAASAATVQLSVPVLAAAGGILLLGEPLTLRYLLASVAILGGIALVVLEKNPARSDL